MKFYQQLILCILLLFSFTWADDTTSATPTTFSFSTVTTDLYVETSLSEVCDYDSYVDTINGHAYSYMFTITGETTSSGNIFNLVTYRKFTLTWYFTFADDIDAYSLTARYSGIHIDDLAGVVNLEKGQLMFQYDVTEPFVTLNMSILLSIEMMTQDPRKF
ncbi:hypothetical protein BN1211_4297 [Cyberlindnera jadinii]|uniref:Uncharacterized protein n=1 Tax=Cyberlindnera jadinii (strain ATCC 18201 / CBS 1600 / BCRC 20928 / JCM 3617 / NBRC 0987 / NRRL Y-1542) TaxID=983966 RepID=A0A0H5CGD3_CYBJN|nr:hypothetical protein BN1211_4297 [Cyberlindnera jadinii]